MADRPTTSSYPITLPSDKLMALDHVSVIPNHRLASDLEHLLIISSPIDSSRTSRAIC